MSMPAPARQLLTAVALLAVLAPRAQAQRERAVLRVERLGGAAISAPPATVGGRRFEPLSVQVNAAHRAVLGSDGGTRLLAGVNARIVRADLPVGGAMGGALPEARTSTLTVATADLWLLHTLGDRHTLVTVLRPGLYGDGEAVGNQLRVEGAAFVDRILSPRTTLGLGLSYGSNFGQLLPIPVLHVLARPARQVLVDALLPARADVWWIPRKGLDLGVGTALTGAQYGLAGTGQPAVADALRYANATLGPQLRWAPGGGSMQFTLDGGVTVLRRLRYARGGTEMADLDPGNVGYARAGVQWLF
jgi:hypothetical protein